MIGCLFQSHWAISQLHSILYVFLIHSPSNLFSRRVLNMHTFRDVFSLLINAPTLATYNRYQARSNKIWRRHLSIVDTGNCEAPFRAGCQPLFVLAGCLLLNYSSLLREGHSPTPALQPFFVLTGVLHFFSWIPDPYLNYSWYQRVIFVLQRKVNLA